MGKIQERVKSFLTDKTLKRKKPEVIVAEEPGPVAQPEEIVFSAVLMVSQVIKEMVVLTLESKEGTMHQTKFTFDRSLLPKDYAFEEKRKYSLVVKRI